MLRIASFLPAVWLAAVPLAIGDDELRRVDETRPLMGSTVTIIVYAADAETGRRAIDRGFARIEEVNRIFSDYEPDSECNRLNASAAGQFVPVSREMASLLATSLELSCRSDGAFDVTVGPLSRLWRRARRRDKVPDAEHLHAALSAVGYRHLQLDREPPAVRFNKPEMRLDFGGIAKGYAADQALQTIRELGLPAAIVNAGGDLAIGAPPPGAAGWKIGVAPLQPRDPPSQFLRLKNCGIASSGDAWQFLEVDGRRYSHIIDPRTGWGVQNRCGVTVIAANATLADGLASAVSVLGPKPGIRLVERFDRAGCLLVCDEDGRTAVHRSTEFPQGAADE